MSISIWVFIVFFICMEDLVNGKWDELKTVMEGDVLTLQTRDTESLSEITWLYKRDDQTVRIAQMYQGFEPFYERLIGRVKMNPKTGALTIWNISTSDSGLYQVSPHNESITEKRFRVDVYSHFLKSPSVQMSFRGIIDRTTTQRNINTYISMWAFILYFICVEVGGEVNDFETVKVMEGGVLNLHPGLEDLKGDVQIMWTTESGRENIRLAQMYQGKIYTHYDVRFTGRVQLDQKTGILTIMDIRTNESGLYEALIIINTHITGRRYKVDVYAPVSVPAIRSSSSVSVHQSTGTSQETEEICSVFCSVKNDRDVSMSWYKGGEMLNQTSNPDLNINLSLPLELHYNDPEIYSCTAVNPVNNKTLHLHMKEICPRQEDCQDHCGVTEALIRLVLSGLVGITTVGFLIDHLRFCSSQRRAAASVC